MGNSRTIPVLILMTAAFSANGQTTWHVDDDNACPGTGTELDPFCTIQAAIDEAVTVNGDDVLVADGTYNELINFNGKAITVRSSNGAGVTTIDGTGLKNSVVTCDTDEGRHTVLDGFTITGGNAVVGGGMYISESGPTVTNCTFRGNSASTAGGGMWNYYSNPKVTNCAFIGNSGLRGTGGMSNHRGSPRVTDCTFTGNFTGPPGLGGGMRNADSNATVSRCTFTRNSAAAGGGMFNSGGTPTVIDCTFIGNSATSDGGGLYIGQIDQMVSNCTFSGNSASSRGGAMYIYASSPTISNCTFSGNTSGSGGAGICNIISSPTVTSCTFCENSDDFEGGGIFNRRSNPTIANCIFWSDSPNEIFNEDEFSVPRIAFSDVEGSGGSADWVLPVTIDDGGNIDADPIFLRDPNDGGDGWGDDPATPDLDEGANDDYGDLHLCSFSPATDAGDNDAVPIGVTTDLSGDPRFVDDAAVADIGDTGDSGPPVVDMGAHERQVDSVPAGDYDCNEMLDLRDVAGLQICFTGGDNGPSDPACQTFDFDGDLDVDIGDYALFQVEFDQP